MLHAIYLSNNSNRALKSLLGEHWHIKEHAALTNEDYLSSTYKVVGETFDFILKEARNDLKKSKYATISEIFRSQN